MQNRFSWEIRLTDLLDQKERERERLIQMLAQILETVKHCHIEECNHYVHGGHHIV